MNASHANSSNQEARIATLQCELALANLRIQVLEEQLRQQRIKLLGPRSETLSDLQLELLLEEPGVTVAEVDAEAGREPMAPPRPPRERKPHPGRQRLPDNLPRVEVTIPCPPEACRCPGCGGEMAVIGHDESEVLDKEPVKFFVRVTRREKRACRQCEQATVVAAPLPDRIIEKGLAGDRIVIDVLVGKYSDHLPLYRQSEILEREAGLELSRATLDGWMMTVGETLQPVAAAIRKDLLAASYLQADETTVPVQMHDKRGSNHTAYLWQYGRVGGETVFDFQMSRERAGPLKFLGQWEGKLQTDAYIAYEKVGGPKLIHFGCWAHARRKFVDTVKVNPQDAEAIAMVCRMDALFRVDSEALRLGLSQDERQALRVEHSHAFVQEIHEACLRLALTALPQSMLGKAVAYTLNNWDKLKRCLDDPEVELSNNLAENSMRPIALGRKNWLHVGSEKSGPKVAAILSVVESCRRLGLPVKEYLGDVLPGLARRTLSQVARLTPARWAASRG